MNKLLNFILNRLVPFTWFLKNAHARNLFFSWEKDYLIGSGLSFLNYEEIQTYGDSYLKQVEDLKSNVDSESMRIIEKILDFYFVFFPAVMKLESIHAEFAISGSQFAAGENQKYNNAWKKQKEELIREIGLNVFERDLYMECGFFHHGLTLVPPKVLEYINNTIFIDAGACIGESALIFRKKYHPAKILSFEISPKNIEKIRKNVKNSVHFPGMCEIEIIPCGLGSIEQEISFDDAGDGSTTLFKNGDVKAKIIPLDALLPTTGRIGFVKADLEGYAVEMMKGMLGVIRRDHPVLSISIYHTWQEFTEVKKILQENFPEYRIVYRNLGKNIWEENVLLAWPDQLQ